MIKQLLCILLLFAALTGLSAPCMADSFGSGGNSNGGILRTDTTLWVRIDTSFALTSPKLDSALVSAHRWAGDGDKLYAVIYEDDAGSPGDLVAVSTDSAHINQASYAEYIVDFNQEAISGNTSYWIGFWIIPNSGGSCHSTTSSDGDDHDDCYYIVGTGATLPDPFGSGTFDGNCDGGPHIIIYGHDAQVAGTAKVVIGKAEVGKSKI